MNIVSPHKPEVGCYQELPKTVTVKLEVGETRILVLHFHPMTRHELRTRCQGWPQEVIAGAVRSALRTTGRTVGLTRSEIPEFSDHVAAWLVNDTVTAEPTWLNVELPDSIWSAMQASVQ